MPSRSRRPCPGRFAHDRPEAGPASADRVTVTRRVAAPAPAIFLLVSDPARPVDIDGSGMLRAAPGSRPLTAVGQTFDIDMDRRPLGEVPNTKALHQLVMTVPDHLVRCTVTKLIPDRFIEWAVTAVGKPPPAMSTAGGSNRSQTANAWSVITATGPA